MSANNIKLTLDTIAPSGGITSPSEQISTTKTNGATLTINKGDASFMLVWFDGTQYASAIPTGSGAPTWEAASTSRALTFTTDGYYYAHVILQDLVGNRSAIYNSPEIIVDSVKPTIESFNCYDTSNTELSSSAFETYKFQYTNERTFGFKIKAYDSGSITSGLKQVKISSSAFESDVIIAGSSFNELHEYAGTLTFKASVGAGSYSITATAYDEAGNSESTQPYQMIYDPVAPNGSFTLKKQAADTDPLMAYIKQSNNSFCITMTNSNADVAFYRLWGDFTINGTGTTQANQTWTAGATSMTVTGLAFTTSDGTKEIHVQYIDKAGNVHTPVVQTRVYDATAPVASGEGACSLTTNHNWIAAGSGTVNSATISYTAKDVTSKINTITFSTSGGAITATNKNFGATTPQETDSGSFTFTSTTAGQFTITMVVTDMAGNSTTKTCQVNVESAVSLTSVVLSGHALHADIFNDTTRVALAATVNNVIPGSGGSKMYVWTDTTNNTTTVPSGTTGVDWDSTTQSIAAGQITKNIVESANNWLHVKAVSNVGNVAYLHKQFTMDKTAPSFTYSMDDHINSRNNVITISGGSDALSGLDSIKIEAGDNTNLSAGAFSWAAYSNADYSITLATKKANGTTDQKDGTYSIIVTVRDKAGNTTSKTATWEFDETKPTASVVLKENDGTTNKKTPSADNRVKVQITFPATNITDNTDSWQTVKYQVYGDISTTEGGESIEFDGDITSSAWKTFSAATITTNVFYCTDNAANAVSGETKHIYVKILDDADNISDQITTSFVYNPRAAELVISNVSHDRISCVHTERLDNTEGTISTLTGDYADVVTFNVTSDQTIKAWKVTAYTTYPTSNVDGSSVTAIAERTGSYSTSHYSRSGITIGANTPWTVVIDGQDFRTAVGGSDSVNKDGVHYIIVFGQNEADTWSIAGTAFDA